MVIICNINLSNYLSLVYVTAFLPNNTAELLSFSQSNLFIAHFSLDNATPSTLPHDRTFAPSIEKNSSVP